MVSHTEIIEKIKKLLAAVTGDPTLVSQLKDSTDIITEVGLDSIQMINFILVLEDEFSIEVDFESLDYSVFKSIKALSQFIYTTLKKPASAERLM